MTKSKNVFAPVVTAVILVLFAGSMAIRLGIAGDRFLPSLNTSTPALATIEPTTAPAPKRLSHRVVVVIIDGLRLRESYGLPYLQSLRKLGIDASAVSHYPTFSRPNYVTIVTGVPPRYSGVRTNHYNRAVRLDSVMDRANASGLSSAYVGNVSNGLPVMFTRPQVVVGEALLPTIEFSSDFADMYFTRWPGGFEVGARRALSGKHSLIVLLPGDVDEAGHEFGADSDEYRAAARFVDHKLQSVLGSLDLTRDTVVVMADHGHTDSGGHGGLEPEVLDVPLILAGAGIRPGAALHQALLVDVAPTIATLLGLPPPTHGIGQTLTDALNITEQAAEALHDNDKQRISRNQRAIAKSKAKAHKQLTTARLWRFPIAFALLAVLLASVALARRVGAIRLGWQVLLISVPAFPVTYYLLLGALGQQYSPSVIPERGDVFSKLLQFGLISTGVHVVTGWLALRKRVVLRDRLATANAITICGLFLSLVPAGLAWAWFTGPVTELPGPSLMVLVPATYIAVACYAMASAITLGLEIVIFFARAVDPRIRLRRLERATQRERARLESEHDEGFGEY